MDPTPAELPPGCLVLLIRLSADMTASVVTGRGESAAFAAARDLTGELVEGLVNTAAGGYAVGAIDVAVLGYRTGEDGSAQLFSLLPGGNSKAQFVPLTTVAEMPAEAAEVEGGPRKWAVLPECAGEPSPTAALAAVYLMVAVWLTGRFAARPPVVVHCTGIDGLDDGYFRVARSLGLLATGHGSVRLMHYVFAGGSDPIPLGTVTVPPKVEPWASLFTTACELPENADAGKPARRALAMNDWDITDLWDALFSYSWREDTVEWAGSGGFSANREMWAQKMGNSPEQWEDAYAVDTPGGAAAIADGASSGIYCSIWAKQLSSRFLTDRPDTREPIFLNKWVNGLRTEWRTAINYSNLNWSKQAKVDQTGAAATFLSIETGPADERGNRPWRASAVGDASLFWVRDGRLVATFPVVAADQFGSAPLLVRSNPGFRTLAVAASGICQPGDRFVLATDAVASRLFKSSAGTELEWGRFETITQDDWRAELDALRQGNDMVNDDCTLIVLRVSGESEEAPEVIEEVVPLVEATPHPEPQSGSDLSPAGRGEEERGEDGADLSSEGDAIANTSPRWGEVGGASPPGEGQRTSNTAALPTEKANIADIAIAADVGDLMFDIPHDPPQQEEQGTSVPPSPEPQQNESTTAGEPPAARDGFPESTDTRD